LRQAAKRMAIVSPTESVAADPNTSPTRPPVSAANWRPKRFSREQRTERTER